MLIFQRKTNIEGKLLAGVHAKAPHYQSLAHIHNYKSPILYLHKCEQKHNTHFKLYNLFFTMLQHIQVVYKILKSYVCVSEEEQTTDEPYKLWAFTTIQT